MTPPPSGAAVARDLFALVERLYPLCRSLSGAGVRRTLELLRELIPLELHEVPSGTRLFDWTVPDEWNIREAWIADADGRRIVDFGESNLHVMGYSTPVDGEYDLAALRKHLHVAEQHPGWIPYRTSYFQPDWGFCLSRRASDALEPGRYAVRIDSSLAPGAMTYGELLLPGRRSEEFLVTTHICHPSLCDDNLSGIAVASFLARALGERPRRFSYRFLFVPALIGPLAWLARNQARLSGVWGGVSLTCLGNRGVLTYKRSLQGDGVVDRGFQRVLERRGQGEVSVPFGPGGADERQFNAPGFRIPFGALTRGRHGDLAEHHTSADDMTFISGAQLADALDACLGVISVLEEEPRFIVRAPPGEPQLSRRGIYRAVGGGGGPEQGEAVAAMLWILALSDGRWSLPEIADRSGLPLRGVQEMSEVLVRQELLERL